MTKESRGRPSKYKKEFSAMLVEHSKAGLSFEAFGGVVGVCKETLYSWTRSKPDFLDAKKLGESYSRLFWEKLAIAACLGKVTGCSPSVLIFSLKNKLAWKDRQPDEAKEGGFEPVVIEMPTAGKKLEIRNKK